MDFNYVSTQEVVLESTGEILVLPCPVNYIFVDNDTLLEQVFDYLDPIMKNPNEYVGLDVETNGFSPFENNLHTIQLGFSNNTQFIFDMYKLDPTLIKKLLLNPCIKVGHNLKFDAKFINHKLNIQLENFYDSYIAEMLLYLGDDLKTIGLSLDKVMDRRCSAKIEIRGTNLGLQNLDDVKIESAKKRMQKSFENVGPNNPLTPAQLSYAAHDVSKVVFDIVRYQIKDLKREGPSIIFSEEFYEGLNTKQEKDMYLKMFPKKVSLWETAQLEFKFLEVVVDMELKGFSFSTERHEEVLYNLSTDHAALKRKSLKLLGPHAPQKTLLGTAAVNLDSPEQVLRILNNMGLDDIYSTDAKELENTLLDLQAGFKDLKNLIPILESILAYKKMSKLCSSFGVGLYDFINPITGKVHPNIKQMVDTGRMASNSPNIQQMPKEVPWLKKAGDEEYNSKLKSRLGLRECFLADKDKSLVIMDYSSQEMCIAACVSLDPFLIKGINDGKDPHCYTVSLMENEDYDKVFQLAKIDQDPLWVSKRSAAKTASFGSLYGSGAWNLAQQLRIDQKAAQEILDKYWAAYPRLAQSMPSYGEKALNYQYSNTVLGRRRIYVGGFRAVQKLRSMGFNEFKKFITDNHPYMLPVTVDNIDKLKEKAIDRINRRIQRQAGNHVIQGTASDMMKTAATYIYQIFKENQLDARIVALVHDEVIVEAHNDIVEKCNEIVKDMMLKAFYKFCPFVKGKVEGHISPHWKK